MTEPTQPSVVKDYLDQLRASLDGVPRDVGKEIFDGVSEELAGLNKTEATVKINALGDPAFIAAEARKEAEVGAGVEPAAATSGRSAEPQHPVAASGDPRWYIVLASLLVAIGGVVVPVLGLIVGLVMVWLSKTWFRWEKWVATLLPLLFPVLALVGLLFARMGFGSFTLWHLSILSIMFMPFIAGTWLLWRGLHRSVR